MTVVELISKVPTGRDWGNKMPETRKGAITQNDVWEGPVEAGERGEYYRCTWRSRTIDVVLP